MPINPPAKPSATKEIKGFVQRNAVLVAFLSGQATGIVLALLLGGS